METTRLRPHWRPTHDATPHGFDRWLAPDGGRAWAKILNPDGHLCRQVWAVAPGAHIVLRNHELSEQKAEVDADPVGTARRHAEFWADFCSDHGLWDNVGLLSFEGINEHDWNPPALPPIVEYEVERVRISHVHHLSPCVLQMNTGWPTNHSVTGAPPDWAPFERLRRALLEYGGILGVHEYWDRRGPSSDDWTWNAGRILQQPATWDAVPVLITECGYDQAVNAPQGTPNAGWLGHLTVDQYMEQLTWYDLQLRTHPRLRNRVLAALVFTHDFDHPWDTFDTLPLTDRLCLHAEWVRNQPVVAAQPVTVHMPQVAAPAAEAPTPQPPPTPVPAPAGVLDPMVLAAIVEVEAGGQGMNADGGLKVRFEAHIFERELRNPQLFREHFRYDQAKPWTGQIYRRRPSDVWSEIHTGRQADEYAALELAKRLDANAAYRSISMGAGQVMGFNHARIGFPSAAQMFDVFSAGEAHQVIGAINYILADANLVTAVRNRDWETIALLYNGPGQVAYVSRKLQQAYAQLTSGVPL